MLVREVLFNLVLAVLTLLTSYAIYYIKQATDKLAVETSKIKEDEQRELVQAALWRLEDVATKTVKTIEQTVAKDLRKAVKEGVKDKQELVDLSVVALQDIRRTMEPEYLVALQHTLGDVDAYIKNTIESKVLELKEGAA